MTGPYLSLEDIGVGAFLRREREERGISRQEIADITCIRTPYLEKIEEEEFSRLPATPILRGFVRAYANHIGVDEDEVVRHFNSQIGADTEDIDDELASKLLFSPVSESKHHSGLLMPVAAVVLFIFVSGALLWFVRGKTERYGKLGGFTDRIKAAVIPAIKKMNGKKNGGPISNTDDTAIIKDAPGGEPVLQQVSAPEAGPAPEIDGGVNLLNSLKKEASPQTAPVGAAPGETGSAAPFNSFPAVNKPSNGQKNLSGNLGLTIKAVEDTWLRLKVDMGETYELLLPAGEEKSWTGIEQFVLTVGNAAGTNVMLNGKAVTLPQTTSNVVRDFVISDKTLKLRQASSANSTE